MKTTQLLQLEPNRSNHQIWLQRALLLSGSLKKRSKIRRVGYRVHPEFNFHTCTMQWEVFCTDTFTTATKVRGGAAGTVDKDRKWRINSAAEITWLRLQKPNRCRQLLSPKTLSTFVLVFFVCVTTFSPGDIGFLFLFFFLRLSRVRSGINWSWISTNSGSRGNSETDSVQSLKKYSHQDLSHVNITEVVLVWNMFEIQCLFINSCLFIHLQ